MPLDPLTSDDMSGLLLENRHVRFIFAGLTRRGAYLLGTRDGASLYSDRNGFTAALAHIDNGTLQSLADGGWLERQPPHPGRRPDQSDANRWTLTKSACDHIRRIRSGETPAGTQAPAEPPPKPQGAAASPVRAEAVITCDAVVPQTTASGSPLAWLHGRRDKHGRPLLSDEAFEAGERLRADFWFGAMTPRVTASWSPVSVDRNTPRNAPGAGLEGQERIVAARERVRRALAAVGPELSGILIDVCCHEKGLEDAERDVGWPVRSGRIVLHLALERLARHYGLLPPDNARTWAPEGRVRQWGSEGYRPTMG
jgi:hypothetical protein